jgi:putative sterol carrier protein
MAILFPSDEWIKAAMDEVNRSAAYREAARSWEGDLVFDITALPGPQPEARLYMDLWHGECRSARQVAAADSQNSEFLIAAPLPVWRKVLEGKLDPIRGLVSRQLKLQGNLMKIMKAPKAAVELVNSCSKVSTTWPQ